MPRRVAVVTGASGGIGRETAVCLAEAGHDVVVAGRRRDALESTADAVRAVGQAALVVEADVTEQLAVEAMWSTVMAEFGRVDCLVNNSGVPGPSAPFWEIDMDDWRATFQVNVEGIVLCSRSVLPIMMAQGGGNIVNIGSLTGKRPLINRTAYAASKLAVVGLTRTMALDAGPHGVRVNVVSPGPVAGERLDWVLDRLAEATGSTQDQARRDFAGQSALRRLVDPRDVAQAVAFLASDAAAAITGIDLDVNAGFAMQ